MAMRSVLVRCYHRHNILANTTSIVDMASIFNAINGLTNEIKEMKNDINEVKKDINEVKKDINDMKKDISKLNLKVDQTRVLSGSLVEANIRNYFTREYGESFRGIMWLVTFRV